MKIIGISCSPRKGKTTYYTLEKSFDYIKTIHPEIKTEIIDLGGMNINGCHDCGHCKTELKCSINDDFNQLISKLSDPDIKGIIIATPVYLGTLTALCKAFLERSVMFRRNGFMFRNKVGGVIAVGAVRNGGQELTIQTVQAGMLCHDMIIVSDGNETSHFGGTVWSKIDSGIEKDDFGIKTANNLAKRIADLILKIK